MEDQQENEGVRRPLPSRPVSSQPLLSPVALLSPNDDEPLIRRKPVLPRRSSRQSLEARSYEMDEVGSIENPFKDDDNAKAKLAAPKAFRKTHRIFGYDLGYWRMPVRQFSIFSILFLATFLPLYYVSSDGLQTTQNGDSGFIEPFSYGCYSSGWTFVGINVRFGRFSYGGAKSIDLAWNWIIGRGLQGVLTLLAYRVFNDALLRAAEMTPLSYELYASLALYSTKPDILWQLMKGLYRYGNWRTKAIFMWLFISTVYLAVFSSLMDACTGYEALAVAQFEWPNGTLQFVDEIVDWEDSPNIIVNKTYVCLEWSYDGTNRSDYNFTYYVLDSADTNCYRISPTGSNDSYNTEFPTAESLTLYDWADPTLNTSWWNQFKLNPLLTEPDYWRSWNFTPSDPNSFSCGRALVPPVYQWGFSFEWAFVTVIFHTVWLYGLWILWLDCDTNSELCKKGRRLGLWRAVADISEAMREELGPNICAYSEQELADALKNKPPIKYYTTPSQGDEPGHIGLSSRARSSGKFRLQWDQEYGTMGRKESVADLDNIT